MEQITHDRWFSRQELADRYGLPVKTPAEWASKQWMDFTLRIDTSAPWMKQRTKKLIDNFEIVVGSRWPTVQDIHLPCWGRAVLQVLSSWRYALQIYQRPIELAWAQRLLALRRPRVESL